MKFAHFFVDHPVFAAVISILITLLGAVALPTLPVAQYPQIAPPTVNISATYPGASAETLASTVAQPIEEQINGVEDMLYMSSQSTADGHLTITVTFKLGADVDKDLVLVENRAQVAVPQLPAEVQATGLVVRKASPDLLLAVHFYSPDNSLDQQYISNYFTLHVRDELLRLQGVGDLGSRAARDYAMRIWIDPDKAAQRNLTVDDVVNALRADNIQVAAGSIGQPPFGPGASAQQLNIQTEGLLTTPQEFGDIIVKRDSAGRITRVSDVARVDLGAADYTTDAYLVVRQPNQGDDEEAERRLPARPRLPDHLQPHRIRRRLDHRGREDARHRHRAGRDRDRGLPADLARGADPDPGHPRRPDRFHDGAEGGRFLA